MISVLELKRALTAPMLLPHTTTLNCLLCKNATALSTSSASFFPREIYYCSTLFPHPAKSKQARPTLLGRRASCEYPSQRLEELPCRQRMMQRGRGGAQTDRGKGRLQTVCSNRLLYFRLGLMMLSLQRNLGGRISMKLYFSMQVLGS